ncbi:hypothetical protein NHH03_03610 [Stieleria sp. TO1_6]|uniref:hypothetical protein n=1 Tax=Stieleria tagensis TaxID=2956795 RepID=UPI00209AFD31|nr:hypothetical protein [Stieleria tagensis]MCO8120812.1 hypothetical protein [Stieleria tagensis]
MIDLSTHRQLPRHSAAVLWGIVLSTLLAGGAFAGEPPTAQKPEKSSQTKSDQLAERVTELVQQLRSVRFAQRENATEMLYQLGHATLPALRKIRDQKVDAEQTDRLNRIIDSLAEQDLESRIQSFLRGGEADLDNWPKLEHWFGDSPRVRELYVELYRMHPELVEALGGSRQQLTLGMNLVKRRLMERGVSTREMPRRVDLIALLLPMTEPGFDAGIEYDVIVAQLLQRYQVNDFHADPVIGEPFQRMVALWMTQSDENIREQVLRLALQWKLDVGLRLALKTVQQTPNPIVLARCMQAIARQGNRDHIPVLAPFLNDPRIVFRKPYLGPRGGDVQVGDVAAAAIAFLSDVPVTELGFAEPAEHDIFGIIYEELVIPVPPERNRKADDTAEDKDGADDLEADALDIESIEGLGQFEDELPKIEILSKSLQRLNQRRASARAEIHAKALKLVPQNDRGAPEKS